MVIVAGSCVTGSISFLDYRVVAHTGRWTIQEFHNLMGHLKYHVANDIGPTFLTPFLNFCQIDSLAPCAFVSRW